MRSKQRIIFLGNYERGRRGAGISTPLFVIENVTYLCFALFFSPNLAELER